MFYLFVFSFWVLQCWLVCSCPWGSELVPFTFAFPDSFAAMGGHVIQTSVPSKGVSGKSFPNWLGERNPRGKAHEEPSLLLFSVSEHNCWRMLALREPFVDHRLTQQRTAANVLRWWKMKKSSGPCWIMKLLSQLWNYLPLDFMFHKSSVSWWPLCWPAFDTAVASHSNGNIHSNAQGEKPVWLEGHPSGWWPLCQLMGRLFLWVKSTQRKWTIFCHIWIPLLLLFYKNNLTFLCLMF